MFNLSAHEIDALPALSNRRDWKCFDEKLSEICVNDVENIIARGQVLIEAHDELERGSYEATVKRHFDLSYARKLRIIAGHPVTRCSASSKASAPSCACRTLRTGAINSQTLQYQAGKRFAEYLDQGLIPLVLNLLDHDPNGIDMSRDNEERLALYTRTEIEVRRIALNMDQVREHNPPENFVKESDTRTLDLENVTRLERIP